MYDYLPALYICESHVCLVPADISRSYQIPWNWSYSYQTSYGCGEPTWVLCKSSNCFYPLSHLSSLKKFLLKSTSWWILALFPTTVKTLHGGGVYFFKNVHAMQPRLALNYVAQTDFEFTIPLSQPPSPGIPSENQYPLHSQGFFVCLFVWGTVSRCTGWP